MKKFSGAKNCGSFVRSRVSHSYPTPDSITCEGVFNQHYFTIPPTDTDIFHVSLSSSSSLDPISGKTDHFLCLSGSSKYDGPGLRKHGGRPPVELVFVLDVSGSMGSGFQEVTLKQARQGSLSGASDSRSKLDAAKEALIGLLDNLHDGDSFGLITFTTGASVVLPLQKWDSEKKEEIIAKINGLKEGGGTELLCGLKAALSQYDKYSSEPSKDALPSPSQSDPSSSSSSSSPSPPSSKGKEAFLLPPLRRIFYLTDMLISHSEGPPLFRALNGAAARQRPVHATVIGFGVDFDVSLTNSLAKVPACNYFSVNSSSEFIHQMTWEFDYLVFPIAEDITVTVKDRDSAKVLAVCGSPTPLEELGEGVLMYTSAAFPSQTQGKDKGSAKGGVILAKVALADVSKPIEVVTSYRCWDGSKHETVSSVTFAEPVHYDSLAVRKGVLLSRYVCLTRCVLTDIHSNAPAPSVSEETGIVYNLKALDERRAPIQGDAPVCLIGYAGMLRQFLSYYDAEAEQLDDTELGLWRSAMGDYVKKVEDFLSKEGGQNA